MDKLKENAFALALGGVGIVLLVLAYFIIWQPWQELRQKQGDIQSARTSIQRYTNPRKKTGDNRIPTQDDADVAEKVLEAKKVSLESGIEFYDERAMSFQRYFADAQERPGPGEFYTQLSDRKDKLLETYRTQYNIFPDDKGNIVPELDGWPQAGGLQDETTVDEDMKKYWILEAVVNACLDLEIRGLQSLDFKRGRKKEENKTAFVVDEVPVKIMIHMPFSRLKELLAEIFASPRVPFSTAQEISFKKIPESLQSFSSVVKVHDAKDAAEQGKSFDEILPEPDVEVSLNLLALDWRGVKQEAGAAEEDPEADDDDDS